MSYVDIFFVSGTLVNLQSRLVWHGSIVYKHWPDTCEFITQTVELWNRWI